MKTSGYHRTTVEDFNKVKQLVAVNFNYSQIGRILKLSDGTVGYMAKFDTHKAYLEHVNALAARSKAAKAAAKTVAEVPELPLPVEQVNYGTSPEKSNDEKILTSIERMANAMERLAKAWESQPEKKRGLFN